MKKIKSSILFIAAILLSACEIPGAVLSTPIPPSAAATLAPIVDMSGCISPEPTQNDIDRALAYTDEIFSGTEWTRSYTVESSRVSVTFNSDSLGAVGFVEALIFPCGYGDSDLDTFFSNENWQIVFANYESYKALSECKSGGSLRLYQFNAVEEGGDYKIKYWALNDTDTRVVGMMIVFPVESESLMDEYASALFPDLTSCN
ncbi:MAG: hypothetical protein HY863_01685 [Chloroflexi bacterium]|nr:hypothetical protein [Chloroflexota bacterium]